MNGREFFGGIAVVGIIAGGMGAVAMLRAPTPEGDFERSMREIDAGIERADDLSAQIASAGGPVAAPVVTADEFARLKLGMTVDECEAVVGRRGRVVAESAGWLARVETREVRNADGSVALLTFRGGRLHAKAQSGLRPETR